MKKIFTFILLAISTLAMAQAFPGDPGHVAASPLVYDTITLTTTDVTNQRGVGEFTIEGTNTHSANSYKGKVQKVTNSMKFTKNKSSVAASAYLLNTSATGTIKSIKVKWAAATAAGTSIQVHASATDDFSDTYGGYGSQRVYNLGVNDPTNIIDWSSESYQYMHIESSNSAIIDTIIICWQLTTCNITTSLTYRDAMGLHDVVNPSEWAEYAEISVTPTTARPGEEVTLTVTPGWNDVEGWGYDVESVYAGTEVLEATDFDSESFTYTYSFIAGSEDINFHVTVFKDNGEIPDPAPNNINPPADQVEQTGIQRTQYFTSTADTEYDGTAYATSSNPDIVSIISCTNSSITYKTYNRGTAIITIDMPETANWYGASATFSVTVNPEVVYLIAQDAQGKYQVLAPDAEGEFTGTPVNAIEVEGSIYATEDPANMVWYVCNRREGGYSIEVEEGVYLGLGLGALSYTDNFTIDCSWTKDANNQFLWRGQATIANNGTEFELNYNKTNGVKAYSTVGYAPERTLRSNLTPDAFSTVCMPYSFIAGDGLTVYTIDNKETKGDGTHIFFCPVDSGVPTEAGRPYIIQSTSTTAQAYQIGDASASAQDNHDGLYGVMSNTYWSALWDGGNSTRFYNGNVLVFKNGSLAYVEYDPVRGGGGGLAGNSACILLDEISTTSTCDDGLGGAAPRRISLAIQQPQTPTAVENILSADHINWNEPVYNVMGQRVARGTTGVLVQNGQKFIAL